MLIVSFSFNQGLLYFNKYLGRNFLRKKTINKIEVVHQETRVLIIKYFKKDVRIITKIQGKTIVNLFTDMIVLIAPEKDTDNEIGTLNQLFEAGLMFFHLRKPNKNF